VIEVSSLVIESLIFSERSLVFSDTSLNFTDTSLMFSDIGLIFNTAPELWMRSAYPDKTEVGYM
jgi:hypothetical protein